MLVGGGVWSGSACRGRLGESLESGFLSTSAVAAAYIKALKSRDMEQTLHQDI